MLPQHMCAIPSKKVSDMSKNYDGSRIVKFLRYLGHREAGGITELRIISSEPYLYINGRRQYMGNVVSGYYNEYEKAARDIKPFDGKANIYVTINPCIPDLLARAANRLQIGAKVTTSDDEILCDLFFPIDLDPRRPSGISSTDAELQLALAKLDEVAEFLSPWATVVKGMSGNGGHGLIRLPGYPNNEETRRAKERLTRFLSETFSDEKVSTDKNIYNLSRIWKLYGTVSVKGDSIPSRPHRRSHLEIVPVEPVDLYAHLDEIIPPEYGAEPSQERDADTGDYPFLDVKAYLNAWGGEWRVKQRGTVTWFQLRECPIHTDNDGHEWECGICQYPNGAMGAKCMHDPSYSWQDFKKVLGDPREFYTS